MINKGHQIPPQIKKVCLILCYGEQSLNPVSQTRNLFEQLRLYFKLSFLKISKSGILNQKVDQTILQKLNLERKVNIFGFALTFVLIVYSFLTNSGLNHGLLLLVRGHPFTILVTALTTPDNLTIFCNQTDLVACSGFFLVDSHKENGNRGIQTTDLLIASQCEDLQTIPLPRDSLLTCKQLNYFCNAIACWSF